MEPKLSASGYGNGYCILVMIEKWRTSVDNRGSLLTDLSKAFDCLDHNHLIAKLNSYVYECSEQKSVYSYLANRVPR